MEYTKRLLVLEGLLSTLPDCQGWMIGAGLVLETGK